MDNAEKAILEKFLKDVEFLKLRFPVAQISEKTGYKQSNVSNFINGKRVPSKNFLKKFYEIFFPEIDRSETNDPIVTYMSTEEYIRTLLKQISDKDLVIEMLQEKNKQLTEELNAMKPAKGKAGGRHHSA